VSNWKESVTITGHNLRQSVGQKCNVISSILIKTGIDHKGRLYIARLHHLILLLSQMFLKHESKHLLAHLLIRQYEYRSAARHAVDPLLPYRGCCLTLPTCMLASSYADMLAHKSCSRGFDKVGSLAPIGMLSDIQNIYHRLLLELQHQNGD